ncbi:MAG TPA: site-2 protease family protein [Anaerolineaceae bacterium]|jgi:Zn-dependent protease|nr:site-2 protease family protein [Anaerolineaceae bacterium]
MLNLSPSVLISRLLILVIALTFHEFMHAVVADRLGDDTPRRMGRLNLNPLSHLDPLGSLMLIVVGFGWAKPVQVNPANLNRNFSAGMMWVSLAGPAANFILAILGAVPLRLNLVPLTAGTGILPSAGEFLFTFVTINLLLMIFNLIPLAPLDGEKILEFFLPARWSARYASIQSFGPMILMVLIFLLPLVRIDIIGGIMNPVLLSLRKLLIGV